MWLDGPLYDRVRIIIRGPLRRINNLGKEVQCMRMTGRCLDEGDEGAAEGTCLSFKRIQEKN